MYCTNVCSCKHRTAKGSLCIWNMFAQQLLTHQAHNNKTLRSFKTVLVTPKENTLLTHIIAAKQLHMKSYQESAKARQAQNKPANQTQQADSTAQRASSLGGMFAVLKLVNSHWGVPRVSRHSWWCVDLLHRRPQRQRCSVATLFQERLDTCYKEPLPPSRLVNLLCFTPEGPEDLTDLRIAKETLLITFRLAQAEP